MSRYYYDKKPTVEECKDLSIHFLKKNGYLKPDSFRYGGIQWFWAGCEWGDIKFCVDTANKTIRFIYKVKGGDEDETTWELKDYTYQLATTPCHFGGVRYWFLCGFCHRKVGVLYFYGKKHLACRTCLNLSYKSRNQSRSFQGMGSCLKLIDLYEKMNQLRVKFYKGEPTKRMRRFIKQIEQGERFMDQVERMMGKD